MGKEKISYIVLQENSTNGQIFMTIPSKIAAFKGWKKGTKVELRESMGNIYLVEVQ